MKFLGRRDSYVYLFYNYRGMFSNKPWVLVLDDDVEVLQFLHESLTREGCRVVACQKIPEARQKILNQKFECIVLDWVVEHGNSEQLLGFIRDPKGFNHTTPVLLASGNFEPELIKRVARLVSGVLIKPFTSEKLVEKLRELIGE